MRVQIAGVVFSLFVASAAGAANWASWRGPGNDGVAEGGAYPTLWSSTENVLWKFKLPGRGASTPIVWDGKIILTCAIEKDNGVFCLNSDGKPAWQKKIGHERPGKNGKASGCNPSAVTDGKHIFVYFKSGDLACLDFYGNVVWQHNLQKLYGEDTLWWDLGTSPVLTRDYLVVAVMQTGPSYLIAFDKGTGEKVWKHDRDLKAPVEAAQSYTTPVVVDEHGQETIVVLGADYVTAHDAADGREIWRVGGLNPTQNQYFRSIASPIVLDGIVVAPYARGKSITAIELGGSGDVTGSKVVWSKNNLGADVPTPAAANGKVYVCGDHGEVACLDAKSGEKVWAGRVERSDVAFSASPVIAGGKMYLTREDGKTFVLELGNEFKVSAANDLDGDQVVATPVFVDGRILLRTVSHLYCIGVK